MTELLAKAIRLLESMPEPDQDAAAFALMDYIEHRDQTRLTDAQIAEVERRIGDPNRVIVSAETARERIAKFGS